MGKHNNFMPSKDMVYLRKDTRYGIYTKTRAWVSCIPVSLTKEEWRKIRYNRVKLPKSWKHWCRTCNLRIIDKHSGGYYLAGKGYRWRVNNEGMFQRGDSYDAFDRWALCDINEVPMPKTLEEFKAAVLELLGKNESPYEKPTELEFA